MTTRESGESYEPTIMQKETVIKDDGRRLIYYRFVSAKAEPAASAPPASEAD